MDRDMWYINNQTTQSTFIADKIRYANTILLVHYTSLTIVRRLVSEKLCVRRKNYVFEICREQKRKKGEDIEETQDDRNTSVRNRKSNKSIRFKSDNASNNSRQGSIRSHHTPSSYMVCHLKYNLNH